MNPQSIANSLVWLQWLVICVIATEAVTEIIVDSKIAIPFHNWIRSIAYPENAPPPNTRKRRLFAFIDALTSCGYCLSVWIAGIFATMMTGYPGSPEYHSWWVWSVLSWSRVSLVCFMTWVAYLFLIHRLSNWVHVAYQLFQRGRVRAYDHTIRMTETEEEVV